VGTYSSAYKDSRLRVEALARGLTPAELEQMVPACPEWTRKELVAHVAGIAADIVAGNVGDAGRADWTEAQIEAARDETIDDVLGRWATDSAQVEPFLDTIHPTAAALTVGDLVVHEQDLRGSLGNRDARDTPELTMALAAYVRRFGKRLKDAGLPTVLIRAGGEEFTAGLETPEVTIDDDAFEVFRALTGRRTKDEIRKLAWDGDPEPYVDLFSSYSHPDESLRE
jgi:uncharacterized protein (TIGR03083 family)